MIDFWIYLELVAVGPKVFVLWRTSHQGTALVRTDFAHGPVEDLDAVEKVDDVDGEPVIKFFVIGLLNARFQVDS